MRTTNRQLLHAILSVAVLGFAAAAHAGDDGRGEQKFGECAACHSVAAGTNGVGPSLHGLIGRKAGSVSDFRYSPAMKRSGIVWTAESLDTFLTDPQKAVPANRMPYAGLTDPADRADLVSYLEKATK